MASSDKTDPIEQERLEQQEFRKGPYSLLLDAVQNHTQVLITLRHNRKLLGRVRAFDRHLNMVLENVQEIWTEPSRTDDGKSSTSMVVKDRFISKMFLRGDSVVLVVKNVNT
ncbi:hypothetical protein P9112_010414 [Eukaryota sp. TZLM1-RC]